VPQVLPEKLQGMIGSRQRPTQQILMAEDLIDLGEKDSHRVRCQFGVDHPQHSVSQVIGQRDGYTLRESQLSQGISFRAKFTNYRAGGGSTYRIDLSRRVLLFPLPG
jgi:hypothetical protein